MGLKIKDNFLDSDHLQEIDKLVHTNFPWYLNKEQVTGADDGYWFGHIIYDEDVPKSDLYNPLIKIFKSYLKYISLCRIHVNLVVRQETPSISAFHTDLDLHSKDEEKITTAIFYLNTCNGVTEFKDGDKVDTVRNRLIMFPTNTSHRAIGQTDTDERIVLNFNFINGK